MNGKRLTVGASAILALAVSVVLAQDASPPCGRSKEKSTPEAQAAWEARFQAINREISGLSDHPWAGTYYYGDGKGANVSLTLAPESGFVFKWRGCMGVYDRNFGDVVGTDRGSLKLALTYENCRKGFQGVAEDLVPIPWGERHYLIPVDDVVGFCNAVNSGSEPRDRLHGFYYLRVGDQEKPVKDAPELPEQYQAYLFKEPIHAEIVHVGDTEIEKGVGFWTFHKTVVTLNVGRSDQVLPGISFQVCEPRNILCEAGSRYPPKSAHNDEPSGP
ncbi:MAG: hypothetical protein ACYTFA_08275 [Planctomycetota bacterium]|jgi:hypothetical protein